MSPPPGQQAKLAPHPIQITLRNVGQLFNTMDPSPFHEKDLDSDAEEFIESWAQEYPLREPLALIVYLEQWPQEREPEKMIRDGVHNYFAYRAKLNRMEFRHLMKDGRKSLLIGLLFLGACLALSEALVGNKPGTFLSVVREGLTIGGWVAMWRPMEIYLYEWWPLRRRGKVFEKMSRMKVEVLKATQSPAAESQDADSRP